MLDKSIAESLKDAKANFKRIQLLVSPRQCKNMSKIEQLMLVKAAKPKAGVLTKTYEHVSSERAEGFFVFFTSFCIFNFHIL